MHVGGFPRGSRGGSRALQGSRGLQNPKKTSTPKNAPAAYRQSLEPWARLKFHVGWSGWTRPPAMARGGVARLRRRRRKEKEREEEEEEWGW